MATITVLFALNTKMKTYICALGGLFEAICKKAGQFSHGDVFIAEVDIFSSY